MPTSSLARLRKELRQYLTDLKSCGSEDPLQAAINNFLSTVEYRRSGRIALFYPTRHELDLTPLIETCWADNKKVYLPCLFPKPFKRMCFLPFTPRTHLQLNRYNIPQPSLPVNQRIDIRRLDIVITPLLAFGSRGERLGMGGGYYDRTFAFQKRAAKYHKPRLWAVALEAQRRELTASPWDVNLHGVATEKTIYRHA